MNLELNEEQIYIFGSLFNEFYANRMASLKEFLANIERSLILDTLENTKGDQKKADEILGLKYTTLYEKNKKISYILSNGCLLDSFIEINAVIHKYDGGS